jgi:hypothetical protein
MHTIRVPERTATPEELAEDRRRYLAAKARPPAIEPAPIEGNLCAVLVTFAAWRQCCCCQSLTLYVNSQARTTGDFECGLCKDIRENLAKRLRRPSLHERVRFHLAGLFSTANDNHEVAHAS